MEANIKVKLKFNYRKISNLSKIIVLMSAILTGLNKATIVKCLYA